MLRKRPGHFSFCVFCAILAALAMIVAQLWPVSVADAAPPPAPVQNNEDKVWNETVDKAIAFLRKSQAEDGSFSKDKSIGITGVVLAGLLQTGRVDVNDPMVVKALGFIKSLVNTKDGHIAGQDPKNQLKNYVTAVNVLALAAADKQNGKFSQEVAMAAKFLKELQWDEGEKTGKDNLFYGGFGYDSKNRPDMSNSQMALDALTAAGVPTDDPAMKKVQTFVSRSQNLKSEHQDQPWAGKINDGSFIYNPAETKNDPTPDGALPGYGSMTYAGIKSLIYAGVKKDDKRVLAALAWIRKNYTVEANPGLPAARSQQGLYYYYHTMAKCMDVLSMDDFADDKGVKHNWRRDLTQALAKRQKTDGSWTNEQDRWMEGDPNLVTGYALMTLSYTKPKK
jgi:squalene-hopene/tetraprenyl-beta-curcumene cyclase